MSIDERARAPSLVSSARPPLSAHRPGVTFIRRTISRSSAACRRTTITGTPTLPARARRRASMAARNAAGLAYGRTGTRLLDSAFNQLAHALGPVLRCPAERLRREQPPPPLPRPPLPFRAPPGPNPR